VALEPKVKAIIEILLKDQGTRAAVVGMAKAKGGADALGVSLKRTESQSARLGQTITRFFGAAILGRFAIGAVKEFANLERRIGAISTQMRALGIDAEEQLPRVRAFLDQIQAGGGGLLQETVPAFQQLLGVTRDVDAAMTALSLASDLSEAGFGDVTKTAGMLVNVLQGRAKEAAKEFGIQMVDVNGKAKTQVEIVQELITTYQGFGDKAQDTQQDLDKVTATWNEFKLSVGKGLAFIGPPLFKFFQSLGPMALKAFGIVKEGGTFLFDFLGRVLTLNNGKPLEFLDDVQKSWNDAMTRIRETSEAADEEIAHIWGIAGTEAAMSFTEGTEKVLAQARRNQADEDAKAAAEAAKKAAEAAKRKAEAEMDIREQALASELDLVEQAAEKEKALRLAVSTETLREMERIDLALADLAQERALTRAREEKADLLAVEEAFALAKAAILQKYDDIRAEQQMAQALRVLEANEEERDKIIKITNEMTEAQIERARDVAEIKRQLALQAAQESIGALTAVFGENKAFNVAEAIIDTYAGAAEALKLPYPYGEIIAAARIAMGFGYVRKILSTNPGSGFGSGGGRGAGGGGGNRRAQQGAAGGFNLPGEFADRARGGGGGGGSSTTSITNNNRPTTEIHFNGPVLMDRQGERKLARIVERAQRRDRARKIR